MNTTQQHVSQQMQSNRHLKEWCDNIASEIKVRYALGGRHKQETSRLLLQEGSLPDQAALSTRQAEELQELKYRNNETRIAIQERHTQEDVALSQTLKSNSVGAGLRLRTLLSARI